MLDTGLPETFILLKNAVSASVIYSSAVKPGMPVVPKYLDFLPSEKWKWKSLSHVWFLQQINKNELKLLKKKVISWISDKNSKGEVKRD